VRWGAFTICKNALFNNLSLFFNMLKPVKKSRVGIFGNVVTNSPFSLLFLGYFFAFQVQRLLNILGK
jgi:hypothetical protein